jgi:hypothetical protein
MTVESEILVEAGHAERNYWRDLFRYRERLCGVTWLFATSKPSSEFFERGGSVLYHTRFCFHFWTNG